MPSDDDPVDTAVDTPVDTPVEAAAPEQDLWLT